MALCRNSICSLGGPIMLLAVAQQEDEVPTVRREAIAALVALLEDDKRKVEVSARGDRLCLGFSCSFLQLTSQLLRAQQVLAARPPVKSAYTRTHASRLACPAALGLGTWEKYPMHEVA